MWLLFCFLFLSKVCAEEISCHQSGKDFPKIKRLDGGNIKHISGSSLYSIQWNCTAYDRVWVSYNKVQKTNMTGTFIAGSDNITTISYIPRDALLTFSGKQLYMNLEGTNVTCDANQRVCVLKIEDVMVHNYDYEEETPRTFADLFSIERMSLRNATFCLIFLVIVWIFIVEEIVLVRFVDTYTKHLNLLNITQKINNYVT